MSLDPRGMISPPVQSVLQQWAEDNTAKQAGEVLALVCRL